MIFLYLILAALFSIVIVQDFKSKRISVFLLPAILICASGISILSSGFQKLLETVGYNISFVIIQFVLLFLYLKFRYSLSTKVVDKFIGLGDLLFLVAITPLLSLPEFIVAYLLSLILSIGYFSILSIKRKDDKEIPLAGVFSIVMLFFLLAVYPENLQSIILRKVFEI